MTHIYSNAMGISESAPSLHVVNSEILEVLLNVVSAGSHSLFLSLLHLVEVSLDVAGFDSHAAQLFFCDCELAGVIEQSFGRNASFIDSHAANVLLVVDADGLEALLGSTDCCGVATRASTDDSDVILLLNSKASILLL